MATDKSGIATAQSRTFQKTARPRRGSPNEYESQLQSLGEDMALHFASPSDQRQVAERTAAWIRALLLALEEDAVSIRLLSCC